MKQSYFYEKDFQALGYVDITVSVEIVFSIFIVGINLCHNACSYFAVTQTSCRLLLVSL